MRSTQRTTISRTVKLVLVAVCLATSAAVTVPAVASAGGHVTPQFCNLGGTTASTSGGTTANVKLTLCGNYQGRVYGKCYNSGARYSYEVDTTYTSTSGTYGVSCTGFDPLYPYGYDLKDVTNGQTQRHQLD